MSGDRFDRSADLSTALYHLDRVRGTFIIFRDLGHDLLADMVSAELQAGEKALAAARRRLNKAMGTLAETKADQGGGF